MRLRWSLTVFSLALSAAYSASSAPVINEIMFHPPGIDENTAMEWIELHNSEPTAIDLTGAKLTKGVAFSFPAGTTIGPNGSPGTV